MRRNAIKCTILMIILALFSPLLNASADTIQLKTTASCNEITLAWNSIKGAYGYLLIQVLQDGKEYPLVASGSKSLTFTHKDLEENKEYCYLVKATDKKGIEIARSAKQCARTLCNKSSDDCVYRMEFVIDSKTYNLKILGSNNAVVTKAISSPPVVVNNRAFISAKYVIDNLKDAKIEWDAKNKDITIYAKIFDCCKPKRDCCGKINTPYTTKAVYRIGKATVNIDGQELPIEKNNPKVTPLIIGGRAMIPFRSLGETLGALVGYLSNEKKMILDFPCQANKELDDGLTKFFCKCLKVVEKRITSPTGVIAQDGSGNKIYVYIEATNQLYGQIVVNSYISVTGLTAKPYSDLPGVNGLSIRMAQGFDCDFQRISLSLTEGSQFASLDGNMTQLSKPPMFVGSELMIGIRDLSELMSVSVSWIGTTKTINLSFCDTFKITCQVDSKNAGLTVPSTGNGNAQNVQFKLLEAPTIQNGLVYMPLKSIISILGGSINCTDKSCALEINLCPCPATVKWSGCGVIQSVARSHSNQMEIKLKDCKTGKVDTYFGDSGSVANNSSSISWTTGKTLGDYEVGYCAKYYSTPKNTTPKTYYISQWIAVPSNDHGCCSTISAETKFYCTCLKVLGKNTTAPTGVTAIDSSGKKHFITIDSANPVFNQISTDSFISVVGIRDKQLYDLPGVRGLIVNIVQDFDCRYRIIKFSYTEGTQDAVLNGKTISLSKRPIRSDSELMFGIRDFVEIMGVDLAWDAQKQTLEYGICQNYKITSQIGSTNALFTIPLTGDTQNFQFTLSKAPQIQNGSTYISFKSIIEFLGGVCTIGTASNGNLMISFTLSLCQCQ